MRKIAMRCTQEQFDSIKDRIKSPIKNLVSWDKNTSLVKNFNNMNIVYNTECNFVYEIFDAETFLKACDSWEDEVKYEIFACGRWIDAEYKVRIKPQPDYSKEIEALQLKAKENGMKCVINFEKI